MNTDISNNPLWNVNGIPEFEKIKPDHIKPAVRELTSWVENHLSSLEKQSAEMNLTPSDITALLQKLDQIHVRVQEVWSSVDHLFNVMNSDALTEAYESCQDQVVDIHLRINQCAPLFKSYVAIKESAVWTKLNSATQRYLEQLIKNAQNAGLGLSEKNKTRFNEIEKKLQQLSTQFQKNEFASTKAFQLVLTDPSDVDGFPESLKQLTHDSYIKDVKNKGQAFDDPKANLNTGPWLITLDYPCYVPLMQHARNRNLREKIYNAAVNVGYGEPFDNQPVIKEIIRHRNEKARLLGFKNYSELSLSNKMAQTISEADQLLENLRQASWKRGQQDIAEATQLALQEKAIENKDDFKNWDRNFWQERLKEKSLDISFEELKAYFPLDKVCQGLWALVEGLFDIKVKEVTQRSGNGEEQKPSFWHPDVKYFHIYSKANGNKLASFILDPFARPETKRSGAWVAECVDRYNFEEKSHHPVIYITTNFPQPSANKDSAQKDSLLNFRNVLTLFHEFGHALQHMLTEVDVVGVAGLNGIEWDAVEIASQFMENWCYHKETLIQMSHHYKTGEKISEEIFKKIQDSRQFFSGFDVLTQVQYALLDLRLHDSYDPDGPLSPFDLHKQVSEKTNPMPYYDQNHFLCSFSHIFAGGYAAGYYSYKWAEVLSSDCFSAFEEIGLDNPNNTSKVKEMGQKFRNTLLKLGGSEHPAQVFEKFRGRKPQIDAFLIHHGLNVEGTDHA